MPRPDAYDISIMLGVDHRDTIPEMAADTGLAYATIHSRLQQLQKMNLINPPRKPNAARDYSLTEEGKSVLRKGGYRPPSIDDVFK